MKGGQRNLYDLTLQDLRTDFEGMGIEPYRANQIYHWLYQKRASGFDRMTDLPQTLRTQLEETYTTTLPALLHEQTDQGVAKDLLELGDGLAVECVRIDSKDGATACISSQTGCELGCAFCATARAGPVRNLSAGEIVGQYLHLSREIPIRNVVLMGMGEPFLNYETVMKAIHVFTESEGLKIGARRITVSTAGMVPEIYRFAEEHSQVNLAISLNAPDDATRKKIMPIARYYPIDRLMKACHFYTKTTRRRLTFEYVLLREINDKPKHAEELAKLVKGDLFHVNLIAHNPVKGSGRKAPEKNRVEQFLRILTDRGVAATLRRSPGQSIDAACGQLTTQHAGIVAPASCRHPARFDDEEQGTSIE